LGTGILQGASLLQGMPDETFLGLRCAKIAEFIINAQPTILLIFFVAGLRFFIQYGHLSIKIFSEIFDFLLSKTISETSFSKLPRFSKIDTLLNI